MTEDLEANQEAFNDIKAKFETARIISAVLLIGFLIISLIFITYTLKFANEMKECNQCKTDLEKCQDPTNLKIIPLEHENQNSKMSEV